MLDLNEGELKKMPKLINKRSGRFRIWKRQRKRKNQNDNK